MNLINLKCYFCSKSLTFESVDLSQVPEKALRNNYTEFLTSGLILALLLFLIGLVGVLLHSESLLTFLLSIELLLLASLLNFVLFAIVNSDPKGLIYALVVLTVAAAESVVGLGILISAYNAKKETDILRYNSLKY
jgi:NADH-quinone oxidoreductase subunit K